MRPSLRWAAVQWIVLLAVPLWPWRIGLDLPGGVRYMGLCCMTGGCGIVLLAALSLKGGFRPSLQPHGPLIRDGVYGVVRHPAYSGIILAAFGLSLWKTDLARMALATILLVFFDAKSRAEEACIEKAHPEYAHYKEQVIRRFLPGLY